MKQYGANKATEFNKGSLSPIYKAAKSGELKVEKWFMSKLYDLADYYGYDHNGSVANEEADVLRILDHMNDLEATQELIDSTTELWFERYTEKVRKGFNRNYVA